MSYSEFLNTFTSPISNFVNWLGSVASVLLSNYIFITIFGLSLFISLFWFFYESIATLTINRIEQPILKTKKKEFNIPNELPEVQKASVSELKRR